METYYNAKLYGIVNGFVNKPKLSKTVLHKGHIYTNYAEVNKFFKYAGMDLIVKINGLRCEEMLTGIELPLIEQTLIKNHVALLIRENCIYIAAILDLVGNKECLRASEYQIERYQKMDSEEMRNFINMQITCNFLKAYDYEKRVKETEQRLFFDQIDEYIESGDPVKCKEVSRLLRRTHF